MSGQGRRLRPAEAAEAVGVTPGTLAVWRCTQRYDLPYYKAGSRVYYWESDVNQFIASRTAVAHQ